MSFDSWREWRPRPPCEMCGYGGDGPGPWLLLRARYCRNCGISHVLCEQCPAAFGLNNSYAYPGSPLLRCPRDPEVLVMLAVLNGGDG